jgi:hypothetical protein
MDFPDSDRTFHLDILTLVVSPPTSFGPGLNSYHFYYGMITRLITRFDITNVVIV